MMLALMLTLFAVAPPINRWEATITAMEKRDRTTPPSSGAIHFCGSSSIVFWDLNKSFPKMQVIKRGFGGSRIADSTHFADRIILPYKPRTIVFYAGDNDIAGGLSPERVLADFRAFAALMHKELPKTTIHYIAIKPSVLRWKLWPKIQKANALIEAECKRDALLSFIDIVPPMLNEEGKPRPELLAKDGLHLSPEGYKIWTAIVMKHIAKK